MQSNEFELITPDKKRLIANRWDPERAPIASVGIVHGLGEHIRRYHPVAEFLTSKGLQVFGYDQRGHGRTGGEMPAFSTLSSDIATLVRHMEQHGSENPRFLYGQSMGGGLVLYHALTHSPSVTGILASSPLLLPARKPPRWKILVGKSLGKIWPSLQLSTGINPNELTHDPTEVQRYRNDALVHHRVSAALGLSMLEAGLWSLRNATQLAIPTLLMHGTHDTITSPSASRDFASAANASCEFKLWSGLLHDLHFETDRERVLNYAVDWIVGQAKLLSTEAA
jgi:alpha-beta hydrolase superfamily lysophospholipase